MMHHHYNILLVLGVCAFIGIIGAWIFQKIRCPQVVGYIVIGLVIGQTGIGLVDSEHIKSLQPFTYFALGMIGFLVGGELKLSEFHKYGKQFAAILIGEGILAFLLVGGATGTFLYLLCHNTPIAIAGGIVLGAIASATDPASTIDVLWEYRSKGVLTTALIAVVALDDALAMSLYSIGKSIATIIAGGTASVSHELIMVARELSGAVILGIAAAGMLNYILRNIPEKEKALAFSVCTLFLVIGLSVAFDMDVILSSMTLGFGITNLAPKRSEELFKMARGMSIPIYVLFFVLVGARLNVRSLPLWIWEIAIIYVFMRSLGKFAGSWAGGYFSKADLSTRNYCGLGLFAQGGVAIGLSIVAGKNLQGLIVTGNENLGDLIVSIVTTTTLMVQLIGPPMTKLAVKLAGEIGKNITEDDIIASLKVSDVIIQDSAILENDTLEKILDVFSNSAGTFKIVKKLDNTFAGVISFDSLREILPDRDTWSWLLASDFLKQPAEVVYTDTELSDALTIMSSTNLSELPVMEPGSSDRAVGIIERSRVMGIIRQLYIKKISA